jgi:hypothetical protein
VPRRQTPLVTPTASKVVPLPDDCAKPCWLLERNRSPRAPPPWVSIRQHQQASTVDVVFGSLVCRTKKEMVLLSAYFCLYYVPSHLSDTLLRRSGFAVLS